MIPKIKDTDKILINKFEFKKFEIKYSATLPETYKEFLLTNGAGIPEPPIYYKDSNFEETECIGLVNIYSLDEIIDCINYHCYEEETNITNVLFRSKLIPIAQADMGLICICLFGEDYGKIYFWLESYDMYFDDIDFNYKNLREVSLSFELFINNFGEPKEEWFEEF